MRQPPKPKPQAVDEVVRVLRIYDMLDDELRRRQPYQVIGDEPPKSGREARERILMLPLKVDGSAILATAERIAARTEG